MARIRLVGTIPLGWIVDAYRRPNASCSVLEESIYKLPEPARCRAQDTVHKLLTLAYKQAPDGSKRPLLPDSRPLHDQRGLFEIAKGQLRFFWIHWTHVRTHVPHYNVMLLLDVVEKKTRKLHPDVIRQMSRLRREALANYRGPLSLAV